MTSWWVNQSRSFEQERGGGYMWAPIRSSDGRRLAHWDAMAQVAPGDRVLNYARGLVHAVSIATTPSSATLRPTELPAGWGNEGRQIRLRYEDALDPVPLGAIPMDLRLAELGGPFDKTGEVKQGYLYPLTEEFAEQFFDRFGQRFPGFRAPVLPPEAEDDVLDLLRRLVGTDIRTVEGRVNRVLRLESQNVIVGTDRSPEGQPVPIAEVRAALDRLRARGSVVVDPPSVGYRSAFVGAVLLTLPGTRAAGSPPVITVVPMPTDSGDERAITFEGDLDRPREGAERGEQVRLRRLLFGSATHAQCGFCGATLPVGFVRAAHIKLRSACTDEERRDLANVAMSACVFGCDALYELGFIAVAAGGAIEVSPRGLEDPSLRPHLERFVGRRCLAATSGRASYFAWHRANKFRA
jgi:hypothetical protein